MSTLRKDPVSGGWVIMAEERSRRPRDFQSVVSAPLEAGRFCPFCEGNESATPNEVLAQRAQGRGANSADWSLRVVPNKFAVLRIEGELNRAGDGIYDLMNGVGAHEIVIETPRHDATMGRYSQEKMEGVIQAYRARVADLHRDQRFKYIQIFRNFGTSAGAMLDHPHSQIIALPITPRWVNEELASAHEHYSYKERCLFCDIVNQELKDRSRIVYENASFVAIAPFASRFPFETRILPKQHSHDFRMLADGDVAPLAEIIRRTVGGIERALESPPFNFVIHTAPRGGGHAGGNVEREYRWHIEIIPRATQMAGFEWGTGFYINPTLPDKAAEYLRAEIAERPDAEQPVD